MPCSPASTRWLWPFHVPDHVRHGLLRGCRALADQLEPGYRWLLASVLVGTAPFLAMPVVGWPPCALFSALGLAAIVATAAVRDRQARGLAVLGSAYLAHNAATIFLVHHWPDSSAGIFPDGAAYWHKSRDWIAGGFSDEYETNYWLLAHGFLILVMALAAYPSLGLVPLYHGFYQVDLMNFYVGNLMAGSRQPLLALGLGWHPWSLLRGVGFAFLIFEVASWSLERLTGTTLSTRGRRQRRWRWGFFFLALDGTVKYFFLEGVRETLAINLLPRME